MNTNGSDDEIKENESEDILSNFTDISQEDQTDNINNNFDIE